MTLQLCRVYHCPPLDLFKQPLDEVLAHIACLEAEAMHQNLETARAKARGNRRRR